MRSMVWALVCVALVGAKGDREEKSAAYDHYWREPLNVIEVDALTQVFPDRPPVPFPPDLGWWSPVAVPRGGTAVFQFVLTSNALASCSLRVDALKDSEGVALDAAVALYEARPVPVEANNNGGARTQVGTRPPEAWMASLVREAPFKVAEVLVETDTVEVTPGTAYSVVVDISVPVDAKPGKYTGRLVAKTAKHEAENSFTLEVFDVVAPDQPALHSTYWFWPNPENVSYGNAPEWWSEEHWHLIENSARALHAFGQDTIFTPILDGRHPLIQTIRQADGTYTFDFKLFDRWAETFLRLGFDTFEGHHVGGGHTIAVPPMASHGGVWVEDEATRKQEPLFDHPKDAEPWLAFLPVFYDALYAHLVTKGWVDRYVQCQLDEPRDPEEYGRLAALAREHLPGVRTKDAINSRPREFSPLVDIQVFSVASLEAEHDLAEERRANGQSVWFYHCCSPYPPYPNRHLDEPLSNSRLYPWLAYLLNADGYLYWGANVYRGADPYETSIGPLPNGSQSPGHPPGDNWMFYPTKDGLIPGMRMLAYREGLLDYTLLTMLAEKNKPAADRIMRGIVRSLTDYAQRPRTFHEARRQMLRLLSGSCEPRD